MRAARRPHPSQWQHTRRSAAPATAMSWTRCARSRTPLTSTCCAFRPCRVTCSYAAPSLTLGRRATCRCDCAHACVDAEGPCWAGAVCQGVLARALLLKRAGTLLFKRTCARNAGPSLCLSAKIVCVCVCARGRVSLILATKAAWLPWPHVEAVQRGSTRVSRHAPVLQRAPVPRCVCPCVGVRACAPACARAVVCMSVRGCARLCSSVRPCCGVRVGAWGCAFVLQRAPVLRCACRCVGVRVCAPACARAEVCASVRGCGLKRARPTSLPCAPYVRIDAGCCKRHANAATQAQGERARHPPV